MNIEFYVSKLSHSNIFEHNMFNMQYQCMNQREQNMYLCITTRDAQNEQSTYREVLKLISI